MNNHFVAHFDMLGMSSLIRKEPELAWQKLSALSTAKQERLSLDIERKDTGEYIKDQVRSFTFSDTIVAFSKSDTDNDALAIVLLTTELFASSLHYCVPLRGGISLGSFAFNFDLNLFSGPALLEAYELGESSQWLGISIDGRVAEAVARLPIATSPRGRATVVEWEVPCKGGSIENRFVVNWPESHRNNYAGPIPLPVETFYQPFSNLFGPFYQLEASIRAKYECTVDFFNAHFA
jgi:hypothetical protein